ncbi:MAG TPA: aminopeptidase [Gaiellaceae bacterium]|nr:aminopeptidase [Gaiellaceae bacterium]
MRDPRVDAYADLLLDWSLGVEPGWQVLVATTTEARPLAEALSRGLARRGAYALTRVQFGPLHPLDVAWTEAAGELAGSLAPLERAVVDAVDGIVLALAPEDPPADDDVDATTRRGLRAQLTSYRARGRAGEVAEVRCDFPTPFFARRAGIPLAAYEEALYAACLRDWAAERERMEPVRELLDEAREVRVVARGTDLTLSVDGRTSLVDDGHANMPGGEVYLSPLEGSAEGEIAFDVPTGAAAGVRLRFRGGAVVDASADEGAEALEEALATDDGARRLGELGIGCNEGIADGLRNVLFAEKMAGTVHLALGAGFPRVGGVNRSALHWDLVKDLRRGGELWVDGVVRQRDGAWLPEAAA